METLGRDQNRTLTRIFVPKRDEARLEKITLRGASQFYTLYVILLGWLYIYIRQAVVGGKVARMGNKYLQNIVLKS
jgi:hypothetical protein